MPLSGLAKSSGSYNPSPQSRVHQGLTAITARILKYVIRAVFAMEQLNKANRANQLITKAGPWDENDIEELRQLSGYAHTLGDKAMQQGNLRSTMEVIASSRDLMAASREQIAASTELIAAIVRFDKASSELIVTTNKLTTRILYLTYLAVGMGTIQAIAAVIGLFKNS